MNCCSVIWLIIVSARGRVSIGLPPLLSSYTMSTVRILSSPNNQNTYLNTSYSYASTSLLFSIIVILFNNPIMHHIELEWFCTIASTHNHASVFPLEPFEVPSPLLLLARLSSTINPPSHNHWITNTLFHFNFSNSFILNVFSPYSLISFLNTYMCFLIAHIYFNHHWSVIFVLLNVEVDLVLHFMRKSWIHNTIPYIHNKLYFIYYPFYIFTWHHMKYNTCI